MSPHAYSGAAEEQTESAAAKTAAGERQPSPTDIPTVEDLPGMIGSEEEYARSLRKPLRKSVEEKVEEPPEVSESEVGVAHYACADGVGGGGTLRMR